MTHILEETLRKRARGAKRSVVGRLIVSMTSRVRNVTILACINVVLTSLLGFAESYPLYLLGGIWVAMPTTVLTVVLVVLLLTSILNYRAGSKLPKPVAKTVLAFAILFSLPFGVLSLPMFFQISSKRSKRKRAASVRRRN